MKAKREIIGSCKSLIQNEICFFSEKLEPVFLEGWIRVESCQRQTDFVNLRPDLLSIRLNYT